MRKLCHVEITMNKARNTINEQKNKKKCKKYVLIPFIISGIVTFMKKNVERSWRELVNIWCKLSEKTERKMRIFPINGYLG